MDHLANTARDQGLAAIPADLVAAPLERYRQAVLVGLAQHAPSQGRKQTKTRNLLQRMRDRDDQILLFTTDLAVPFSNYSAVVVIPMLGLNTGVDRAEAALSSA